MRSSHDSPLYAIVVPSSVSATPAASDLFVGNVGYSAEGRQRFSRPDDPVAKLVPHTPPPLNEQRVAPTQCGAATARTRLHQRRPGERERIQAGHQGQVELDLGPARGRQLTLDTDSDHFSARVHVPVCFCVRGSDRSCARAAVCRISARRSLESEASDSSNPAIARRVALRTARVIAMRLSSST